MSEPTVAIAAAAAAAANSPAVVDASFVPPLSILRPLWRDLRLHARAQKLKRPPGPSLSHQPHREPHTAAAYVAAISQALGGVPLDKWFDVDSYTAVRDTNPYWRLLFRVDKANHPVSWAERVRQCATYRPALLPNEDFEQQWLLSESVQDCVRVLTARFQHRFQFLGVFDASHPRPLQGVRVDGTRRCWAAIWNIRQNHWVATFVHANDPKGEADYFDSMGAEPDKRVLKLLRSLWRYIGVRYNTHRFQRGTTQCGMFVIWFVLQRLRRVPMEHLPLVDDMEMVRLRHLWFRKT